jgi:hypothetical protein
VYGTINNPVLGVLGFVVMLAAAAFGMMSQRRAANAAAKGQLRSVGGSASRRTRRGMGIIDRLEARWRDRGDYY